MSFEKKYGCSKPSNWSNMTVGQQIKYIYNQTGRCFNCSECHNSRRACNEEIAKWLEE